MHSLFEPVFDLKIWNPLEVLDVIGHYGEPFYQSRCANKDILHIDRESFGAQMCQNISSQQRLFEADRKNFQPLEDIAFDASPEKSVIVQPGGAMPQFHYANARGSQCPRCLPVKLVDENRGWPFPHEMADDVGVQENHASPPAAQTHTGSMRMAFGNHLLHDREERVIIVQPPLDCLDGSADLAASGNKSSHGPPPLHYGYGLSSVGDPSQKLRKRSFCFHNIYAA